MSSPSEFTEVWFGEAGGSAVVALPYDKFRAELVEVAAACDDSWLTLPRIVWQDPDDPEDPVDDLYPLWERLPFTVRLSAITAHCPTSVGVAEAIHRARAAHLR